MMTGGIDAGSRAIKAVLYDARARTVLGRSRIDSGVRQKERAETLWKDLLAAHHVSVRDVCRVVATGYGRVSLEKADQAVTEITCHARGVSATVPGVGTLVDIGGQDSKVIWLDENGAVRDFIMNDRCAAGTGRFWELVASRLETSVAHLGVMASSGRACPVPINNTCVVFAESEIVGLLASRADPCDIAAGVQQSIAARVGTLVGRRAVPPVVLTGGVARIPGMEAALTAALGVPVQTAPDPEYTGALGAALIAADTAG